MLQKIAVGYEFPFRVALGPCSGKHVVELSAPIRLASRSVVGRMDLSNPQQRSTPFANNDISQAYAIFNVTRNNRS
jgi:hypothetical protein